MQHIIDSMALFQPITSPLPNPPAMPARPPPLAERTKSLQSEVSKLRREVQTATAALDAAREEVRRLEESNAMLREAVEAEMPESVARGASEGT